MKFRVKFALFGALLAALPSVASAKIISMDIHAEMAFFGDPAEYQNHYRAVGVSPDSPGPHLGPLNAENVFYYGGTSVTVDAGAETVDIRGFDFYTNYPVDGVNSTNFQYVRVTFSNIVFDVAGEVITGLSLLEDGMLFDDGLFPYDLDISFTGDSMTFEWTALESDVLLVEGGVSLFRYETNAQDPQEPGDVPVPLSLALFGAGLVGLGFARRR